MVNTLIRSAQRLRDRVNEHECRAEKNLSPKVPRVPLIFACRAPMNELLNVSTCPCQFKTPPQRKYRYWTLHVTCEKKQSQNESANAEKSECSDCSVLTPSSAVCLQNFSQVMAYEMFGHQNAVTSSIVVSGRGSWCSPRVCQRGEPLAGPLLPPTPTASFFFSGALPRAAPRSSSPSSPGGSRSPASSHALALGKIFSRPS